MPRMAVTLFALFSVSWPALAAATERTNFVILLCDDLGYGDLACYGNEEIRSPHIDRLAAEGMRLTDCYSAAPVCSPSRAGLMTGRFPQRLGIREWIAPESGVFLRPEETTLAEGRPETAPGVYRVVAREEPEDGLRVLRTVESRRLPTRRSEDGIGSVTDVDALAALSVELLAPYC